MFDKLSNFIASSNFTKMLAAMFLFLSAIAMVIIFSIQVLRGDIVNPLVLSSLSTVLGVAASFLGVHMGAIIGASTPSQLTPEMTPTNQDVTTTIHTAGNNPTGIPQQTI